RAIRPPRGRAPRHDAAQSCSGAVPCRNPASKMEDGRERAHCVSNLRASPGFSGQKAANRHDCRLWPGLAPPHFRTELAGLPSAKEGLGRPQPGSALHHLVTALSVKKALMVGCGFCVFFDTPKSGDAPCTHPVKMKAGT